MNRSSLFSLVFILILTSCMEREHSDVRGGEESLTVVQSSDIFTLDPHTFAETVTQSTLYRIMEPLIRLDSECKIDLEGSLAEGWSNPDDLTWKFFIRPDVKFHNGKLLTASDVVASILRARNHPQTDVGGGFGNVAQITAESQNVLVIRMNKPSAILPYLLYSCLIMTEQQARRWSEEELNETPIGTGPYRLVSWERGKAVKLEAFEEYWRGKPAFDHVSIIPQTDPEKRVGMLSNGEADLIVDIPVDMVETVLSLPQVKFISQVGIRVIFLGFDVSRDESPYVDVTPNPLKDIRVREAIYRAIDENMIINEVLNGFGKAASQFCSPYVFGFNPNLERLPYDPRKARELLTEAGYPDGFSITLHCPNNRYVKDEEIGEMVVKQLRAVGIDAKLEALPKEIFIPNTIDRKYSFFLMGWDCPNGDASSVFLDWLHSNDGGVYGYINAGGYSNASLDSIIEETEITLDPVKRAQLFEHAQEIGMSDIPWVPLHTQMNLYGVRKNISFKPRLDKQISLEEIYPEAAQ
ncbi:MAG: ABC transporter substrate-binding protein [Candidatus Glassbacteria bacterium]